MSDLVRLEILPIVKARVIATGEIVEVSSEELGIGGQRAIACDDRGRLRIVSMEGCLFPWRCADEHSDDDFEPITQKAVGWDNEPEESEVK